LLLREALGTAVGPDRRTGKRRLARNRTREIKSMTTTTYSNCTPIVAPFLRITSARKNMAGMLITCRGRKKSNRDPTQLKKNSKASVKAIT